MALDRDRLLAIFHEELGDRRRELERGLLELEEEPSEERRAQLLRELFRAAHSLKGAALSVGVPAVAAVSRELEDVFGQLRDENAAPGTAQTRALLGAVDRLGHAAAELEAAGSGHDRTGRQGPGPRAGVPAAPRALSPTSGTAPTDGPGPQRARVTVTDLEAAISSTRDLRLAIQRAVGVAADTAALIATAKGVRAHWQRLRATLDAHGGEGRLPPDARVAIDRLDPGITRLERLVRDLDHRIGDVERHLRRSGGSIARDVQRLGMVGFDEVCEGLDRALRDVAATSGKQVRLEIASGALQLDRSVATALRDPLLHLVRNAVDHGIEPPADRTAAGKPPAGRVRVSAEVRLGQLAVSVSDDGAGIDPAAVRSAAERAGIDVPAADRDIPHLVFAPGLSTARDVTDVSGRGVGLDAVRGAVEAVGGRAEVASTPGAGTEVTLTVPLTLSTMRALLLRTGGETVALPVTAVRTVVRLARDEVVRVEGHDVVSLGGRSVPLAHLDVLQGFAPSPPVAPDEKVQAVVVDTTGGTAALVVDDLLDEQEVTISNLGARLQHIPGVLGGTVLADGTCAVVLNPVTWVRRALEEPMGAAGTSWGEGPDERARVLLAEDTLTTRTLERSILEAAGYEVTVAVDGAEAWRLLQRHGADVVVADVDMPNMDGLTLCEAIRSSSRFSDLPIVLVTSLADDRDRARGLEAGANAYFVKSAFDQPALLDTIARLL